jgi:ATP-binding cassette subfamily B protein
VVVAGAVGAISEVVADLQRALGAAERLSDLLALEPEIRSLSSPWKGGDQGGDPSDTRPPPGLPLSGGGEVVFDRVAFAYPSRLERAALHEFSLDVAPGRTVALVGPSGAGKTTLFQLLLRFYDPQEGAIRIGGRDIRALPLPELRGMIGLVPQEPVIFSGTARENIRLGRLEAGDDEVREAARIASALEFLEKLPQGLDTPLGENGVLLSGGQRQRLAIARAVIRNPRILLLDEATSSLDSENERLIQQALERVREGRTTFVIAHRLSTVTRADAIVLLNEGRIEARGTHGELLQSSPLYARLAELQFKNAA